MNLNEVKTQINKADLKRIYSNKNITAIYAIQFYSNFPTSEIISITYTGQVDEMPTTINEIIGLSKLFEYMMELFKNYHMKLNSDEYENKACPLQIKTRIRARGDPYIVEYSHIIDFKKDLCSNDSCVV